MAYVRSVLFYICFIVITALASVFGVLFSFVLPMYMDMCMSVWAHASMLSLKVFCRVGYRIVGEEHIPKQPCIIVSKHQSAWDTLVFCLIKKRCRYVLKKELTYIPVFGLGLRRVGMVVVDRKAKASALKKMIKDVKKQLDNGCSVVIFPEGTRTSVGKSQPYKPGIAALYNSKDLQDYPLVPAAVNSGVFWNKNTIVKNPGTVTLEFLPLIERGLPKREFMEKLQHQIDSRSDALCEEVAK